MFEIKTNVFLPIQFEISSFTNTNRYIEREGNLYIYPWHMPYAKDISIWLKIITYPPPDYRCSYVHELMHGQEC